MRDELLLADVQRKEDTERERLLLIWDWLFRFSDSRYQFFNYTLSSPAIGNHYSSYDFSMLRYDHLTKEFKLIVGEYKNRMLLDNDKFEKYKKEGILIELQKIKLTDYAKAGCLVWYLNEFAEGLFLADITDIQSKEYPVKEIECRKNNTYYDTRPKDCNLIPFSDGKFYPRNKINGSLDF